MKGHNMTSNDLLYKNVQNDLKNGIFDKKKKDFGRLKVYA